MHLYLTDNIADFFDSFLLKGMVYGIKNKTSAFSKQPFYLQFFWQPFPFFSFFLTCFLYYLLFTAVFIPATKRFGIHSWPKNSSQVIRQVWICCKWCCGKRDLRNINFTDAIFYSFSPIVHLPFVRTGQLDQPVCKMQHVSSAKLRDISCQTDPALKGWWVWAAELTHYVCGLANPASYSWKILNVLRLSLRSLEQ